MLRQFVSWIESRLAAARAEWALAGLSERLQRDIGVGSDWPEVPGTTGMIHAMDPALLRELRDPEPPAPACAEHEPTRFEPPLRRARRTGSAHPVAGAA